MQLRQVLDLGAAAPLWLDVCAARGKPLEVDASGVERLGGLCLQVLLAAQAQWRRDGVAFAIVNPSPSFIEGTRLMGAHDLAPTGSVP